MTRSSLLTSPLRFALCALLATAGCNCVNDGVPTRDADSADTRTPVDTSLGDTNRPVPDGTPPGSDECAERARWIYVVDENRRLVQFQPDEMTFNTIGTLSCPAGGSATPFSMSVDRSATAWVLYSNGQLFAVSTLDASCETTSFEPNQAGFELFGMGYVADSAGSASETLFIAGGARSNIAAGRANLGRVDGLMVSPLGSVPGWPELTGTGLGELYAFAPQTSPPSVHQIDKTRGGSVREFPLSAIPPTRGGAWAFGFWGGRFYIFLQGDTDPSTNVWRLDPSDGSVAQILNNTGMRIVGAGVSTCAPTELF